MWPILFESRIYQHKLKLMNRVHMWIKINLHREQLKDNLTILGLPLVAHLEQTFPTCSS